MFCSARRGLFMATNVTGNFGGSEILTPALQKATPGNSAASARTDGGVDGEKANVAMTFMSWYVALARHV